MTQIYEYIRIPQINFIQIINFCSAKIYSSKVNCQMLFNSARIKYMDCLFCKIIKGEIPSHKIYEDENVLAFLDINPVNPGHTLVIPKKHSRNIFDIEKEDLENVVNTAQKICPAVQKAVNAKGVNVISNNEPVAGQIIFHTHFHIIPRFENDGLKHWSGKSYDDKEGKEIAEKIKTKIR